MPYLVLALMEGQAYDPWTAAQSQGAVGNSVFDSVNDIVQVQRSGWTRLGEGVTSGKKYLEFEYDSGSIEPYHFGFMYVPTTPTDCSFNPGQDGTADSVIYTYNYPNMWENRIGLAIDYDAGTIRAFRPTADGGELIGPSTGSTFGPGSTYSGEVFPFIGNCNAGGVGVTYRYKFYFNEADFTVKSDHAALSSYSSISGQ